MHITVMVMDNASVPRELRNDEATLYLPLPKEGEEFKRIEKVARRLSRLLKNAVPTVNIVMVRRGGCHAAGDNSSVSQGGKIVLPS